MAYNRELKILPSMIDRADGTETELKELSEGERADLEKKLCQNISQALSADYSEHQKEWESIVRQYRG